MKYTGSLHNLILTLYQLYGLQLFPPIAEIAVSFC